MHWKLGFEQKKPVFENNYISINDDKRNLDKSNNDYNDLDLAASYKIPSSPQKKIVPSNNKYP